MISLISFCSQTQYQPQLTSKTDLSFQQQMSIPQRQIQRKPVASSSPRDDPLVQQLSPDIDYSTKIATPAQSPTTKSPYQCEYCPRRFTDKTNVKRHIKYSCKKRPHYDPDKGKRPFKCDFGTCKKRFTQNYNLLVHQRNQGHLPLASFATSHQSSLQTSHDPLRLQQAQAVVHLHANQHINFAF
jgi:hypothetical protein